MVANRYELWYMAQQPKYGPARAHAYTCYKKWWWKPQKLESAMKLKARSYLLMIRTIHQAIRWHGHVSLKWRSCGKWCTNLAMRTSSGSTENARPTSYGVCSRNLCKGIVILAVSPGYVSSSTRFRWMDASRRVLRTLNMTALFQKFSTRICILPRDISCHTQDLTSM